MKTNTTLLLLMLSVIAVPCHGMAQQPLPFVSLPLKEAEVTINRTESLDDLSQMAVDALASRRFELVELFFDIPYSSECLYRELRDVTDEAFKARVVLMMLRSKSGFWPPDFYTVGFFPKRPLDEPIKGILKVYLPNENFDDSAVATAEARQAVAEKLSSALEKAASTKPVDEKVPVPAKNMALPPPAPNAPPSVPPLTPPASPKPASPPPPAVPLTAEPENSGHFHLVLWMAAGAVILTTVVLLCRKCRGAR